MGRENSLYAVVTVNSDSYQSLVKTIDCLAIIIKPKWNFAVTQSKVSTLVKIIPHFYQTNWKWHIHEHWKQTRDICIKVWIHGSHILNVA